jgi:hypothetical protein
LALLEGCYVHDFYGGDFVVFGVVVEYDFVVGGGFAFSVVNVPKADVEVADVLAVVYHYYFSGQL